MKRNNFLAVLIFTVTLCQTECLYYRKKPETFNVPPSQQMFRSQFSPSEFAFDLDGMDGIEGEGGVIKISSVENFPALSGQDISYAVFEMEPCGINLPHVNPRGTELIYVIHGNFLRTAFVEENGGRTIFNDLTTGQITVVPEGLVQYQQNLDCQPAKFISAFNNEDPGGSTLSSALFSLPLEALMATFGASKEQIEATSTLIEPSIARGTDECLKRCQKEIKY